MDPALLYAFVGCIAAVLAVAVFMVAGGGLVWIIGDRDRGRAPTGPVDVDGYSIDRRTNEQLYGGVFEGPLGAGFEADVDAVWKNARPVSRGRRRSGPGVLVDILIVAVLAAGLGAIWRYAGGWIPAAVVAGVGLVGGTVRWWWRRRDADVLCDIDGNEVNLDDFLPLPPYPVVARPGADDPMQTSKVLEAAALTFAQLTNQGTVVFRARGRDDRELSKRTCRAQNALLEAAVGYAVSVSAVAPEVLDHEGPLPAAAAPWPADPPLEPYTDDAADEPPPAASSPAAPTTPAP